MNILFTFSFLPLLIITIIALLSARILVRDTDDSNTHEFAAIDGTRGFLALFVFINHADYWFNYSHDKGWLLYSAIYSTLAHTCITLFFMLSGFLFCYMLIKGREKPIDWLKLFCSRFLRITPLYIFLISAVFLIIAINSNFTLLTDTKSLWRDVSHWLLFTIPGHPDINAQPNSHLITAGVVWTLPYEWFFYLTLPLIGLVIGTKNLYSSSIWLILSCISVYSFTSWDLDINLLYAFLGGFFAAYAATTHWVKIHFQDRATNWILLVCLLLAYLVIQDLMLNLILLSLSITYIACGANLFGILTSRAARALGRISYGIYLMHGLMLYVAMKHLIPHDTLIKFTLEQYWIFIFCLTPILIAIATLTWYWIELPAIKSVSKLTNYLRNIHSRSSFEKVKEATLSKPSKTPEAKNI